MVHFKKSMWPWLDLNDDTQGQISSTLLSFPSTQTTFVWNIFFENAYFFRYFAVSS